MDRLYENNANGQINAAIYSRCAYREQPNVGIYTRLSVDDLRKAKKRASTLPEESMSIQNQRDLLSAHAAKMGWREVRTYADDGYSGSNFDRPGFAEMMEDIRNGAINLILCKDLSRFGRNYIEVGRYTDFILPSLGCRFVALSDGIDTGRDDNDMMPFRSLLNDHYLKDLSRKIKSAHRIMAKEGKRISGRPSYGYSVDPCDHHKFIIDEYAAGIVKRMYEMRLQKISYGKIAGILNSEGILSPREYEYQQWGRESPFPAKSLWLAGSVKRILDSEVYIGNRVQCCNEPISYKIPKVIRKPAEEWIRAENAHAAIISREVWDTVREINMAASERCDAKPRMSRLFRGMLRCADCGSAFSGAAIPYTSIKTGETWHYIGYQCVRFAQTSSASCSSHYIKEKTLKQIVLADIRAHASRIELDKDGVAAMLRDRLNCGDGTNLASAAKELKRIETRLTELDRKTARLYEDKVMGVITAHSFSVLIGGCESERISLTERQAELTEEHAETEQRLGNVAEWLGLIERHSDIQDVDRDLLTELVNRIEVGAIETTNGEKRQDIRIYYKLVGLVAEP